MGNLGAYQTMTTLAKKLGGPLKLGAVVFIGGYLTLRPFETLAKKGYRKIASFISRNKEVNITWTNAYLVHTTATDESGLEMFEGEEFVILEQDKDAVLIAIKDRDNNPFIVSEDFIKSISNFEENFKGEDNNTNELARNKEEEKDTYIEKE